MVSEADAWLTSVPEAMCGRLVFRYPSLQGFHDAEQMPNNGAPHFFRFRGHDYPVC